MPNAGKDVEQQELLSLVGGVQNARAALEDSMAASSKTKHNLSQNQAIIFLAIYPNKLKTYIKTCTQMPIPALFVNCQNLKAVGE